MTTLVEVIDQTGFDQSRGPVGDLVEAVLQAEGVRGTMVVAFVDEEAMAELNGRYRGCAEPTDVLSFRYADDSWEWPDQPGADPDSGPHATEADVPDLGEVIVCPAVVQRYAEEEGADPGRQLAWTLLHGALHLVGYDHEQDNGEMRGREQTLLGRLVELVTAFSSSCASPS